MTKVLLNEGAMASVVDGTGCTAHDLAEEKGFKCAIKALDG